MSIYIGDKEIKDLKIGTTTPSAVYLGENKVRPPFKPRTFTITRTEKSDMSSGWTYSDDAAGLTAGSGDFDDFFGYSAVLLNTSGVETAEMKQSGGVFTGAMTSLGNITSGDNVMIKFPVRGIKMTKSGSVVTLSITEELDKDGYQYYAFQTGQTNNITDTKDKFYLGAYKGYSGGTSSSYTLKSWSGQAPTCGNNYSGNGNGTQYDFCTMAKNNGDRFNIIGYYQRMYITALYMMKYGNPNSQTVIGRGYTSGSAKQNTGATNSITNATGATNTSATGRIKLFGLEDRWGNIGEWVGGAYIDGSQYLYTALSGYYGTLNVGVNTWNQISFYNNCMSSIKGENLAMFAPSSAVNNSSYSTYYCDFVLGNTSTKLLVAGGDYIQDTYAGIFWRNTNYGYNNTNLAVGSRLMYL